MLVSENVQIDSLVLHKIGNKAQEEGIKFAAAPIQLDPSLQSLLLQYFLSPFKSEEYFNLTHPTDLNLNEVYSFVSEVFDKGDELTFYQQSLNIARHLYEASSHPHIKPGELYVTFLRDCIVDGEQVDAIGLFKSESKETFLKVYPNGDSFNIDYEDGININKLDKGCLIYNTERENGYLVSVVDNVRHTGQAAYWRDEFLQICPRRDVFHQTTEAINLCTEFVHNHLPEAVEISKIDQSEILAKSEQYFRENEEFSFDDFAQEVLQKPETIEQFQTFKEDFEQANDVEFAEEFEISKPAVKKQAKDFKSVLKLDKNFHIYIHGNHDLIEKGYDPNRGLHYYRLFFSEEQ